MEKSIKICEDKWISSSKNGKVKSTGPDNCSVSKVNELISNYRWNRILINKLYCKDDGDRIAAIPVSLSDREDCAYWKFSSSGEYTINPRCNLSIADDKHQDQRRNQQGGPK